MSSWKHNEQIFRSMPRRSLVYFLTAIAFLFAALGTGNSLFSLDKFDYPHLVLNVLSAALFSMLWAFFKAMRMTRSMVVLAILQAMIIVLTIKFFPAHPHKLTIEQFHWISFVHGVLIVTFILLGNSLMTKFIRTEGSRFFEAHTEIKLASAIQHDLVPVVSMRSDRFEAYGVSVPSGAVGGDLVDVVSTGDSSSIAYVADVSGHGVKAGVFMSMIKASVRMRYANFDSNETGLLESLNEVLTPLTDAQSYATLAYLSIARTGQLTYSLAGHLPIFHFRKRTGAVEQCSVENIPLGMFPKARFATSSIEAESGDVFVLVTDGLTEVFDSRDEELGYGYIERALCNFAAQPLIEIASSILKTCERFGEQTDDRTLLLLRLT